MATIQNNKNATTDTLTVVARKENKNIDKNQAFIDAQNLYLGTTKADVPWILDLKRFRIYLAQKYRAEKAYYFLGTYEENHKKLYDFLKGCGYTLCFREHGSAMASRKKGNVDTDIVFSILSKIIEKEDFDKVVLASGDGDYWRTVNYLINKNRFKKLLVPNRNAMSSLYKKISDTYYDCLDSDFVKPKIQFNANKKAGSP